MELRLCDSPEGLRPPGCATTIPSGRDRATALDVVVELHPGGCARRHGSMVPGPSDTPREGVVHSPSSTARRRPNGSFPRSATRRPQGGDGVGPHPVRPGEAASRARVRRRATLPGRCPKHRNPDMTRAELVGVSRSVGVSRDDARRARKVTSAAPPCNHGAPRHTRVRPRSTRPLPRRLLDARGPARCDRAGPRRTAARLTDGQGSAVQRRSASFSAVRRSRRPSGARSTSRAGGTSARSPSTCARACRSPRG